MDFDNLTWVCCVLLIVLVVGLFFLGTWVFMLLWNWLLPMLFGLPMITFWQSAGINVFLSMIFGGLRNSSN